MSTATYRLESGGLNGDRLVVERRDNQTFAVVCDGAANGGRGRIAADLVIAELGRAWQAGYVDWWRAILALNELLVTQAESGEATCVGVVNSDDVLCRGASVGHSGTWMISRSGPARELTAHQDRLRLGSGRARPLMFRSQIIGSLALASDRLVQYIRTANIGAYAARGVGALVDRVRFKSDALQDDVAVILLE